MSDLGTPSLTWRCLGNLIRQLPPESRFIRAIGGPQFEWSADTHLLATIADLLAGANWQRSGKPNAPRPKPIPRPGEEAPTDTTQMGTPVPIEEARAILDNWSNN